MSAALIRTYLNAVITMRRVQRRCQMADATDDTRAECRCAEQMVDQLTNEMGRRMAKDPNF
jgi:hypothetical protein